MNTLIQLKRATPIFLVAVAYFALCPMAQAENPPRAPDTALAGGNTADGHLALAGLTTGLYNSAFGVFSLLSNGAANFNTGVGAGALLSNTATENTALGAGALLSDIDGDSNTAVGAFALVNNTGSNNEAMGVDALFSNTTGSSNIAIGTDSLGHTVSGSANTVVGATAGENIVTGINNIYIGADAGGSADESNTIRIGNTNNSACFIAGIAGAFNPTDTVKIDPSTGQLGDQPSSARFKKDIDRMDKTSEAIFSLRPVTFHYRNDKTNTQQFGLIAEEVAKVNPALIGVDKEGKPYCVQYDKVNAMLLNEFLKEHRHVQEQDAIIARQQKEIDALTAVVQKVSAQLEVSKPAPQTVLNH
jgi:hypothetical protein